MASPRIVLLEVVPSESGDLRGKELVDQVIDPEIQRFNDWFKQQKNAGSGLTKLEKEVFRSYLYQKITGVI